MMPALPRRPGAAPSGSFAQRWAPHFFALFWLFIIAVSSIDGYLVYRHRQHILSFERNPVGRALISLNEGQVWYLLAAKFAGTVLAGAVILFIFRNSRRLGLIVVSAVALWQLGLLCYLSFS